VNETSALSNVLKRTIKGLERQGGSGRDGQIRKQQVRGLTLFLSLTWPLVLTPALRRRGS
jgi:hypothetical protein